jgi:pimeloyl-ACP methyl ester carboxylesterase
MAKHTLVSKDGTKITYDIWGQGPVIILVLGALNTRKTGAKLAKLLATHYTVISYDRRGRGDSTDVLPYSPNREVEDLAAVINEVGGQVYLYGHSSGAAIVLEAAITLRNQIKKIAIYEAPYAVDDTSSKAAKEYNKKLKSLLSSGHKDDAVALFMQYIGVSDKQTQAMKHLPMWKGLVAMAPTLAYDSDVLGVGHSLPSSHVKNISSPALLMNGSSSPEFMKIVAEKLSKAIPKGQYRSLD